MNYEWTITVQVLPNIVGGSVLRVKYTSIAATREEAKADAIAQHAEAYPRTAPRSIISAMVRGVAIP